MFKKFKKTIDNISLNKVFSGNITKFLYFSIFVQLKNCRELLKKTTIICNSNYWWFIYDVEFILLLKYAPKLCINFNLRTKCFIVIIRYGFAGFVYLPLVRYNNILMLITRENIFSGFKICNRYPYFKKDVQSLNKSSCFSIIT